MIDIDLSAAYRVGRTVLYEGPYYTEGPVSDRMERLYFTDLSGGQIRRLLPGGSCEVWASSPCPNGQSITSLGDHLICDSEESSVKRYDSRGNFIGNELLGTCAGVPVRVPNDVIADHTGGCYFTDSVRDEGRVFYKSPAGGCHLVADGIDYPNGLVLSADERYLFVAESYANRILRITLDAPGLSADREIWCELPRHLSGEPAMNLPDGLAMDGVGRLWVAHYGMGAIQVIGTQGELLTSIPTGLPLTSNLCFWRGRLIVTGGDAEPGPGKVLLISLEAADPSENMGC